MHQQLLLLFSALDFSHSITHLENPITNESNWMASNFLSLNPSKTEFLVLGVPQQLCELNNFTNHLPNNVILSPVNSISAPNLGVIFYKKYNVICTTYLCCLFLNHASTTELSMGPFYVTQSYPAHGLADPTQPNPIEILKARPNPTQWNDGVITDANIETV